MIEVPPIIDLLPEHLIDQIKAGEVIERPGNLVKEILENALDAGATKLELIIKNNGLDLISLKDNGHGMRFNDLPIAFSRHATSKIKRFEDLYSLSSFGFRGEALASIAAISRLQCIAKTSEEAVASELRIEGGMTTFHGKRQTPSTEHGTELIIQDLFFNTPARLKFVQSQQAEKTFIKKIIFAFILTRPEVEFQIKIDENEKEIFPRRDNLRERLGDIFPKAKELILVEQRSYENIILDLFLIPGHFKGPFKLQNIYINGRYLLDKQLQRVLSNSLEATFGNDDFHYLASFGLPPDNIDVNVHPNKTIIKVMEISKMISLLSSTIREIGQRRSERSALPNRGEEKDFGFLKGITESGSLLSELPQQRHHYNMEGHFSPHLLQATQGNNYFWVDEFFIRTQDSKAWAVSARKLLEEYTLKRLQMMAPSIPLLVSEPFSSKGIKKETLNTLTAAGLELESLGSDTIVIRAIPDWMNGYPLRDVVTCLLGQKNFREIQIDPADWSQSIWDEMINYFSHQELLTKKIVVELSSLLREKLK
jgi:DNA mismatch repair protein MutL